MVGVTRFFSIMGVCLGVTFVLAYSLQWLSRYVRVVGITHVGGKIYWYFVSPGIACHETGHAVGCWLTGQRVLKFVPFCPNNGNTLGYVRHTVGPGWWGAVSNMVIATGPIWFGCLVIVLVTWLLSAEELTVRFTEFFPDADMPNVVGYVCGCAQAAIGLAVDTLVSLVREGWKAILWFYLVFCIASEIGLSSVDLSHIWKGVMIVVAVLGVLSCVPVVGHAIFAVVYVFLPKLFLVHVFMMFALVVNIMVMCAMRCLPCRR